MNQVVASAGFALAVLVSDFEEDTSIFMAWSSLTVNLTQSSFAFFCRFTSVYNSLLCISRPLRDKAQTQERSASNRIGAPDPLLRREWTAQLAQNEFHMSKFKNPYSTFVFIHSFLRFLRLSLHLRFPPRSKWWISGGQMTSNLQQ